MELIGTQRQRDLDQLAQLWQQARDGVGPQFVVLRGKTGVGKTKLVQELYHYAATNPKQEYWPESLIDPGARWQATRKRIVPPESLRAPGESMTYFYWALSCRRQPDGSLASALFEDEAQLVLHAGHLFQALTVQEVANRTLDASLVVASILAALHIDLGSLAQVATTTGAVRVASQAFDVRWPALADRLRARLGRGRDESSGEDPVEVLARNVVAVARSLPVLLIVDDAHWADEETVRFIELLLSRADLKLLIVATMWPIGDDDGNHPFEALRRSQPATITINLEDLKPEDLEQLAEAALQDVQRDAAPLDDAVKTALCERFVTPMGIRAFFGLSQTQDYLAQGPLTLESLSRLPKDLASTMDEYWRELPESVQHILSYAALAGVKFPVAPVVMAAEKPNALDHLQRAKTPHEFLRELDDYLGLFTDEHFHEAALHHKIIDPTPLYAAVTSASRTIRTQDRLSASDETILATHVYFAQQGWVEAVDGAESAWKLGNVSAAAERYFDASRCGSSIMELEDNGATLKWLDADRRCQIAAWNFHAGSFEQTIQTLQPLLSSTVVEKSEVHVREERSLLARALFEVGNSTQAEKELDLLLKEWEPRPGWPVHLFATCDIAATCIHIAMPRHATEFLDLASKALENYWCPCGRPECEGGAARYNALVLEYYVTFECWAEADEYREGIRNQVEMAWGADSIQVLEILLLELEILLHIQLEDAVLIDSLIATRFPEIWSNTIKVKRGLLRAQLLHRLNRENEAAREIEQIEPLMFQARGSTRRHVEKYLGSR